MTESRTVDAGGCGAGRTRRETLQGGPGKLPGVMDVLMCDLDCVMIPWVYTGIEMHQTVHF